MDAIVTGASRGIGLELVTQLLARGDRVVAGARDPAAAGLRRLGGDRLTALPLDVGDDASVAAFAGELGDRPVDLLINNAGVYGGDHQTVDDFDPAEARRVFDVNALGPLRVALALRRNLRRARGKMIHVTSGMGSIEDNRSGGYYAYRMSKAALNMASRCLAVDLRREGIASAVINPGWVQTDMGGARAPTPVSESVAGMLREIDRLTLERSGAFLDWRGRAYPW